MNEITLSDVREANDQWFSRSNKRLFGDLEYRLLTGGISKDKFLVRSTTGWTDMFGKPKRVFYKINPVNMETLKIEPMLDPEFDSLDEVKEFLKEF